MAKANGLDKLSYTELVELRQQIDTALVERKATEERELRERMAAMAAESGFSIHDLFGGKRGSKKPVGVAKYRNPKDASQTWTGRGRKPNWLVDALAKGAKIANFEI
jgi:DNA-binding protein H-NS